MYCHHRSHGELTFCCNVYECERVIIGNCELTTESHSAPQGNVTSPFNPSVKELWAAHVLNACGQNATVMLQTAPYIQYIWAI